MLNSIANVPGQLSQHKDDRQSKGLDHHPIRSIAEAQPEFPEKVNCKKSDMT